MSDGSIQFEEKIKTDIKEGQKWMENIPFKTEVLGWIRNKFQNDLTIEELKLLPESERYCAIRIKFWFKFAKSLISSIFWGYLTVNYILSGAF